MRQPRVDVLYFEGCPNHEPTRALVERIAAELQEQSAIRLVEVRDADAALELRLLGSPTIRVDGRDVEPGADQRRDFVFACRVYRGERGSAGQPDEAWIRAALRRPRSERVRRRREYPWRAASACVAAALAAADIPASELGLTRRARLADAERKLYFWILRRFAHERAPEQRRHARGGRTARVDVERALETLARDELVHRGHDGEITVAYPYMENVLRRPGYNGARADEFIEAGDHVLVVRIHWVAEDGSPGEPLVFQT